MRWRIFYARIPLGMCHILDGVNARLAALPLSTAHHVSQQAIFLCDVLPFAVGENCFWVRFRRPTCVCFLFFGRFAIFFRGGVPFRRTVHIFFNFGFVSPSNY